MSDANDNQTQGTPLVPSNMEEWSDVDLSIPTRAEVEKGEDDKKDDTTDVVEPLVVDEPEDTIEYVEDPGEYQAQDYSFEVTTYDDEGKNPKAHKIASVEDWEQLLEGDPNLGSAAALMKAQRLATKMETNNDRDYKEWKAKKDDYDSVAATDTQKAEQLGTWQKEMDYLVDRGNLPKISKEDAEADWNDSEVAKHEGVKEQVALLNFMKKENLSRTKAGLQPMTSIIDVYNAYQLEGNKQTTTSTKDAKAEAVERKAAGARVMPGSSNPQATAPKGIMVGKGGSLDDLGRGWY